MKRTVSLIAWAMLPILSLSTAHTAMAQEEICTRSTARQAANAGDYQTLCDCGVVTRGFLTVLQRRGDFGETLQNTSELCPALAGLLSDVPTASADDEDGYENDIGDTGFGGAGGNGGGNDDADDGGSVGSSDDGGNDGGNDGGDDGEEEGVCSVDC